MEFKNMRVLPNELIDLMIKFYNEQYVHLYGRYDEGAEHVQVDGHWKIPLCDILESMICLK